MRQCHLNNIHFYYYYYYYFTVGEQVLILSPDSTASKVYSRWKGPATIVEVKSPYSYLVEYNGARQQAT